MNMDDIAKANRDAAQALEAELKQARIALQTTREQLEESEQLRAELERKLADLGKELRTVRAARDLLAKELEDRKAQIGTLLNDCSTAQAQVEELERELHRARLNETSAIDRALNIDRERREATAERDRLRADVNMQAQRIADLETDLGDVDEQLTLAQVSLTEALQKIEQQRERIRELEGSTPVDPPGPVPPDPVLHREWAQLQSDARAGQLSFGELRSRMDVLPEPPRSTVTRQSGLILNFDEPLTFRGIEWSSPDRECLNVARGGATRDISNSTPGSLVVEDCDFSPGSKVNQPQLWHIRAYNLEHVRLTRCAFFGSALAHPNGTVALRPEQHAGYFSTRHGSLVEDCLFRTLGGHALHIVQRHRNSQQYLPDTVFPTRPMEHIVRRCAIIDTDMNPGWGSAALHYTDPGTAEYQADILFEDVAMVQQWLGFRSDGLNQWKATPDGLFSPRNCMAWITITPQQLYERAAEGGMKRHMVRTLTMRRLVFARDRNPAKALAYIRGCEHIVLEDSFLQAGPGNNVFEIDDNGTPEWAQSRSIRLRNVYAPGIFFRVHRAGEAPRTVSAHCPDSEVFI